MRSLQACLDSIPYAVWLGVTAEPDGVLRMRLVGDERHLGNPILSAWHGGVLAGSLQVAMSAALMAANDLDEAPALYEHTTRYVGSSPISKPLTIEVMIVKSGRRVAFVEAIASSAPGAVVATAQASFRGAAASV